MPTQDDIPIDQRRYTPQSKTCPTCGATWHCQERSISLEGRVYTSIASLDFITRSELLRKMWRYAKATEVDDILFQLKHKGQIHCYIAPDGRTQIYSTRGKSS